MPRPVPHSRIQIKERRENILVLLTKGMKGYEIAKEIGVDASTVSRDIHYLIAQSQNYLNSLAKETLPFMYQTSIEGIKNVLKECWTIYTLDKTKPAPGELRNSPILRECPGIRSEFLVFEVICTTSHIFAISYLITLASKLFTLT
ncbi:MAG: helix-turn-helix domain-containing protein [Nitrososphaeraceae archaeon]